MAELRYNDEEHLKLLSIFHYVVGAIAFVFSCFPIIHLVIGLVILIVPASMAVKEGANKPPAAIGWVFVVISSVIILFGWSIAVCLVCAGRFLARRRRYLFCLIVSCLSCLFIPFGTVLGVFTIIVLLRPSVKELFNPAVNQ